MTNVLKTINPELTLPIGAGVPPIRVGFHCIGGKKWRGGLQYQINLLRTLQKYERHRICPVLLTGKNDEPETIAALSEYLDVPVVTSSVVDDARTSRRQLLSLLGFRNRAANRFLIENNIDVVFENAFFWGPRLPSRSVAWFPDLQHLRLPKMFGVLERVRRHIGFQTQIRHRRVIMLSSHDAHKDLRYYFGEIPNKICIVPFAIPFQANPPGEEIDATLAKYNLSQPYILLPNQFWKHKNHLLAVNAMHLVREQGCNIQLVLTGNPMDHVGTGTYQRVCDRINELGLQDLVRSIGMIPYKDLQHLMVACDALLNPSTFEGWSTTVEEAKAIDIPMLLSNLGVHREQAGSQATYFDTESEHFLAKAIVAFVSVPVWERMPRRSPLELTKNAEQRLRKFAHDFYLACSDGSQVRT